MHTFAQTKLHADSSYTAHKMPCSLARTAELKEFTSRLEGANRVPLLVAAPTGFGKTTLLKNFEQAARARNWRVISESAGKTSQQRLSSTYLPALWETFCEAGKQQPTPESFTDLSLEQQLTAVVRVLASQGSGLLITVDNLRKSSARELSQLFTAAAELSAQNLPLLLVLAGRPTEIREIMSGHEFAASGYRMDLCSYNRNQTEDELTALFARSNRSLCPETLTKASGATKGHPFMVHCLGRHLLEVCQTEPTEGELASGIENAQQSLGEAIFEPMLEDFSAGDRAFLEAMAADSEPSKMSDIASRLGKNPQYTGVYRNRLVEAHIIKPASYGKVTFAVPHLREYLRLNTGQRAQDFEF